MDAFLPILSTHGVTLVLFALLLVADYLIGELVPEGRRQVVRKPLLVLLGTAMLLFHTHPVGWPDGAGGHPFDGAHADQGGAGLVIATLFGGTGVGMATLVAQLLACLVLAEPGAWTEIIVILADFLIITTLSRRGGRVGAVLPGFYDLIILGAAVGLTKSLSLLLVPALGIAAFGEIGPSLFGDELVATCLFGGVLLLQMDRRRNLRSRAEVALEDEVRRHGLPVSGMEFIWKVAADGRILDANEAYLRRSGYTLAQLRALRLQDVKVLDATETVQGIVELSKSEGVRSYESLHRTADGGTLFLDVTTIYDVNQDYILAFMRDITERKQVERQLAERGRELNQALVQAVGALSSVMVHRDITVAGHETRVRNLALRIGRELALDDNRLEGLALAAMVHDIGQIQVPAEIINRPRALIPEERALVQLHPEAGYEILKDISFPWPVAELVRQHHENFDGSGYPRGLAGDAILLEARILRVADAVEAMLTHRPFRRAWPREHAIAELRAGSGSLFDPQVAAIVLGFLERTDQPVFAATKGGR